MTLDCSDPDCGQCDEYKEFCVKCKPGFGLKADLTGCEVCIEQTTPAVKCISCNLDESKCNECPSGSVLNQSKLCEECPANCKTCAPVSVKCTECDDGYGLLANGACEQCTLEKCARCQFSADGAAEKCMKCEGSDYVATPEGCRLCSDVIPGCTTCVETAVAQKYICQTCKKNYTVINGKCRASCATPDEGCTKCDATYFLRGEECVLCEEELFEACTQCESEFVCTQGCAVGCASCYGQTKQNCIACAPGYGMDANMCEICSEKLDSCVCAKEPVYNCIKCVNGQCAGCKDGFKLTAGQCIAVDTLKSENALFQNLTIALGAVAGFFLIAFVVALVAAIMLRTTRPKKASKTGSAAPKQDYLQSIETLNEIQ